ncbi:type I polyketide synthase [Nonomuraea sp. NPDC049400]|uniref:type I polyketide synthase n=1 Tax=Nonomuraea sp. NPDC049400 TaxID=3364352 RepID=UPI00379DEBF7
MSQDESFIAVVGMAGRFAGAADLDEYWANLSGGVSSIARYAPQRIGAETYVPARAAIDDVWDFDAEFFGYSPREATILDPQHRIFLEISWAALEDAGYDPHNCPWPVGIYAGSSQTEFDRLVRQHTTVDEWTLRLATAMDLLTARTAYKLGLTGPAVTVQTACSTSLVAVHVAAQALLAGECDAALAGGVSVAVPPAVSQFRKGGPASQDGHVRAFDATASGFVPGDGAGVVVLRRLADAVRDGDHVRAVIRGSALNNDGQLKIGFTAPSVHGQSEVIRAAHVVAGVDAGDIGYVEAHGTGTPLGDPIEVDALTAAFRASTDASGFCWIGSVKTNIGHTDAAAGIAGFIKTVLSLEHQQIPASLGFGRPNPQIDFARSPFSVNTELRPWTPRSGTRLAGVSSLGIGGTNAHAILEEAPSLRSTPSSRRWHLLTLSAKTPSALTALSSAVSQALRRRPSVALSDVAWTLQQSRSSHPFRRFVVCSSAVEAAEELARPAEDGTDQAGSVSFNPVMLLPGALAGDYESEPVYRQTLERCLGIAGSSTGPVQTFARNYALCRLWQGWGIEPVALIGLGTGTVAAACAAGAVTEEEAVALITRSEAPRAAKAPEIPWLSGVTGGWVTADDIDDPTFWSAQLGEQIRFDAALATLLEWRNLTLIDLGSSQTAAAELRGRLDGTGRHRLLPSSGAEADMRTMLTVLGELWSAGAAPHWHRLYSGDRPVRVSLPGYPFERRTYRPGPAPVVPVIQETPQDSEGDGRASTPADSPSVLEWVLLVFEELFGITGIKPEDNFLALGGDSLLAVELSTRANEEFNVALPLRAVYTTPVAKDFAGVLETEIGSSRT